MLVNCLRFCISVDAHHDCHITVSLWGALTILLVLFTTTALVIVGETCEDHLEVWHREPEDCLPAHTPILLSRAMTTDPFRGLTVGFAFVAAWLYSNTPTVSPVRTPLVLTISLIGIAFIVSMFETDAHSELILAASLIGLVCTCPVWHDIHDAWNAVADEPPEQMVASCVDHMHLSKFTLWWVLWGLTLGIGITTFGLFVFVIDTMRSWWFIFEYLFFWMLFGLLGFTLREAERETKVNQERILTRMLTRG